MTGATTNAAQGSQNANHLKRRHPQLAIKGPFGSGAHRNGRRNRRLLHAVRNVPARRAALKYPHCEGRSGHRQRAYWVHSHPRTSYGHGPARGKGTRIEMELSSRLIVRGGMTGGGSMFSMECHYYSKPLVGTSFSQCII